MSKSKANKIGIIALTITIMLGISMAFVACNSQIIDTTYKYDRAYINLNGEWTEVKIASWRDYDTSDSIQIKTSDGRTYYTHLTNVVLIAD